MKVLVTGVAGFVGSHLAEKLLSEKYDVLGVDKFLDNYPRRLKEKNLGALLKNPKFKFLE
jgi:nucleoside-diphosphate-sugar epimerase